MCLMSKLTFPLNPLSAVWVWKDFRKPHRLNIHFPNLCSNQLFLFPRMEAEAARKLD